MTRELNTPEGERNKQTKRNDLRRCVFRVMALTACARRSPTAWPPARHPCDPRATHASPPNRPRPVPHARNAAPYSRRACRVRALARLQRAVCGPRMRARLPHAPSACVGPLVSMLAPAHGKERQKWMRWKARGRRRKREPPTTQTMDRSRLWLGGEDNGEEPCAICPHRVRIWGHGM